MRNTVLHSVGTALLLLVFLSGPLLSQIRQFKFDRLSTEDGLSSFRVYDVAQDERGFLWIGTMNGLNRYDGHKISAFQHDDSDTTSLSHNVVRSLLVDRSGTLWAGTDDGGLNRFNRMKETFTRFVHDPADSLSIANGIVGALCEDRAGNLWIGVRGGGLNKLVTSSQMTTTSGGTSTVGSPTRDHHFRQRTGFISFRHNPTDATSLCSDKVYALLEDDAGRLWIGTENGLDEFNVATNTFTHYKHDAAKPHSLSADFVRAIYQDRSGILWVGTEGGGLNRFDKASGRFTRYLHSNANQTTIASNEVTCILESEPGSLWVGTVEGLNKLNTSTGEFVRFTPDPSDPKSLPSEYLRSIRTDKSGVIWIVTDRGLAKIVPRENQFIHYRHEQDRTKPQLVRSIVETHQKKGASREEATPNLGDALWIATEGLKRIDLKTGKITHYRHTPQDVRSLPSDFVQTLCIDSRGILWLGTYGGGIARFDPRTTGFRNYLWGDQARNWAVHTLREDRMGILWLGTLGDGLLSFDKVTAQFTHYLHDPADPQSLGHNNVFALFEDSRGTLWVGTEGGGLNRFDRSHQRFFRYTHDPAVPHSISNNRVYSIHEDEQSRLWVSTGDGLNLFDITTGTFQVIRDPNSISSNFQRIIEDRKGNLWLSTPQDGIFRFDPGKRKFKQFTVSDGLQSNVFGFGAWKRENGEIIFGGENGFNIFHPDSIRENNRIPGIALTSFKVFDQPASLDTSISEITSVTLNHNQNYFSFEFSSLDLIDPARNMYAYKLEGLDNDWFFPKERRFAGYTDIDPGQYVFRVKGSNSDEVWNEAGIALSITITPPYWATWWFKLLMIVVALTIVAAAYNYRVSKLLEMERMRVRIASDLHDDIGSSLSGIALITDMVRNRLPSDQQDSQLLMDASRAARHTADALKDIVWIVNPEHDRLEDIVLRMKDSAAKLLVGTAYAFHCSNNALSSALDMEFRRNLLLIYKEVLNNIAKYARATQVDISIGEDQGNLHLTIRDNGIGFDESTIQHGNGLNNMRRRAEKLGGTLDIRSAPGGGTTISFVATIA